MYLRKLSVFLFVVLMTSAALPTPCAWAETRRPESIPLYAGLYDRGGGGCNASAYMRLGIPLAVCLALVFCFNRVMKLRKKRTVSLFRIIVLCLICIICAAYMLTLPSVPNYLSYAVYDVFSTLRQRDALQAYVRDHGKLPMDGNLMHSFATYYSEGQCKFLEYVFFRVTPNAAWLGLDLTEFVPVRTWWERNWQGKAGNRSNLNIRKELARRADSYGLYGTKDIITPPVSDDVKYLYKVEDDAVWFRVDRLFEEGVL